MRPEFSPSGSEFHLHRIWKELNFSLLRLRSTDGRQIRILDPGTHNCTTGPDFRNAHILADGIDLFGDVEIHLSANHWYEHKHHKDPNFNRVILHVVADPTPVLVKNEAGFTLLTLSLGPYLRARQRTFRKELSYRNNLRCLSHLHYISEDAFNAQIRKAHREYFNLKSEDFLKYYDPHLSGSKAWKKTSLPGSLTDWV
ncbi:DUF2851 family protein [Balneola sp. MJW-20]|uniref:DUF2851 family protein n=1 Tax=Gracilimonas aurantiaca TaxID=3234185 RepID=UPI003467A1FE